MIQVAFEAAKFGRLSAVYKGNSARDVFWEGYLNTRVTATEFKSKGIIIVEVSTNQFIETGLFAVEDVRKSSDFALFKMFSSGHRICALYK
jgi:hypothetical protein